MTEVPPSYVPLPASKREVRAGAARVAAPDPREVLTVSVHVRRRPGAPSLPHMSRGGQALTHDRFERIYGAADEDLNAVAQFAQAHGLRVLERSASKRIVKLSGTVGQASAAFRVDLGVYATASETYRGREGFIHVPAELADVVDGVFGLDGRRVVRRAVTGIGPVSPPPAPPMPGPTAPVRKQLWPSTVAQLYDFPQSSASGQTIGLLEFGLAGYSPVEIDLFFLAQNLSGGGKVLAPTVVAVAVPPLSLGAATPGDEVTLDIDVAGSAAPGATIAVYFGDWTEQGFVDTVATAVHDAVNNPSVISISYGAPEFGGMWTQAAMDAVSEIFQEAAALGVTVLVASGDAGANGDVSREPTPVARVSYPASDPYVTSCGGTWIANVNGLSFDEGTWPLTGGGVSDVFDLPAWQTTAGVPPSANGNGRIGRGVPDVAGNADPQSGYPITYDGRTSALGGTSAVAPLYAGLVAVINAMLTAESGIETRVGYLNPSLYSGGMQSAFRDIADGVSNGQPAFGLPGPGYTAGPGWDACTGFGSIIGGQLRSLLAYPAAESSTGAVVAVGRIVEHLDVFWIGADGSVLSNWWDVGNPGGAWGGQFSIGGTSAGEAIQAAPGAVAALARLPQHLDVFWIGADGSVLSNWWDVGNPGGAWGGQFTIGGALDGPSSACNAAPGAIGVLAPFPWRLDVFWIGINGSACTCTWDATANDGQWQEPIQLAGQSNAALGAITAVSRAPGAADAFWIGTDGSVWASSFDRYNNVWSAPASVAPTGSAAVTQPGGGAATVGAGAIMAIARLPEHLDVFWLANDGAIITNWRDSSVNDGTWNAPFLIS